MYRSAKAHEAAQWKEINMRKLILAGLIAATAAIASMPADADARGRHHRGYGHHSGYSQHDGWRDYRRHNPQIFHRGNWRAPYRYVQYHPGYRMHHDYYRPHYYVSNPYRYRLNRYYDYTRWVRHYDDMLLVDVRTGEVLRVHRNFYW